MLSYSLKLSLLVLLASLRAHNLNGRAPSRLPSSDNRRWGGLAAAFEADDVGGLHASENGWGSEWGRGTRIHTIWQCRFDGALLRASSDQAEMGDRLSVRQSRELRKLSAKTHRYTKEHGRKLLFSANIRVHALLLRQKTSWWVTVRRLDGGVSARIHHIISSWAVFCIWSYLAHVKPASLLLTFLSAPFTFWDFRVSESKNLQSWEKLAEIFGRSHVVQPAGKFRNSLKSSLGKRNKTYTNQNDECKKGGKKGLWDSWQSFLNIRTVEMNDISWCVCISILLHFLLCTSWGYDSSHKLIFLTLMSHSLTKIATKTCHKRAPSLLSSGSPRGSFGTRSSLLPKPAGCSSSPPAHGYKQHIMSTTQSVLTPHMLPVSCCCCSLLGNVATPWPAKTTWCNNTSCLTELTALQHILCIYACLIQVGLLCKCCLNGRKMIFLVSSLTFHFKRPLRALRVWHLPHSPVRVSTLTLSSFQLVPRVVWYCITPK